MLCASTPSFASDLGIAPSVLGDAAALYLEVVINNAPARVVAEFHQGTDGLTIEPDELREAGLEPREAALGPDGEIVLARLPGVTSTYDAATQTIHITAVEDALAPHVVDAQPQLAPVETPSGDDVGAVVNYTLYASGGHDRDWHFEGVSGLVEARAFSPYGVVSGSFLSQTHASGRTRVARLETAWTLVDPSGPTTYRAGDLIAGGLGWTRPIRLGGLQIRRSFDVRPDLVTTPLAELRGSADVPSTVEVYIDETRRVTADVPAGPFQIANIPIATGAGTARVVVRDALGRETVSEQAFFANGDMLAEGLFDFSAELGFARRDYGGWTDSYDQHLVASASARYGISNSLTVETHVEGGGGLINFGGGAIAGLGPHAIGSLSAAMSEYQSEFGYQLGGAIEMEWDNVRILGRTQRSFGHYADLAAITASADPVVRETFSGAPPRRLDQVAISLPSPFAEGTLNLSYTRLVGAEDDGEATLIGASLNQPLWADATFFATAYQDIETDDYGLFAGVSLSLGEDLSAAVSVSDLSGRALAVADLVQAERAEVGTYAWRLRAATGAQDIQSATASYRAAAARVEGSVTRDRDAYRATAHLEGALVWAGGDLFASNRIDDAFAVVDAGAPGVEVQIENRAAGRTDVSGRLLVPGLSAYQRNRISIDPTNLPLDANLATTAHLIAPTDRAGVVVRFDTGGVAASALISFRDGQGQFVAVGSSGQLDGAPDPFIVGYDGEAYVEHLTPTNRVRIVMPTGAACVATFAYAPNASGQTRIDNIPCHAESAGS